MEAKQINGFSTDTPLLLLYKRHDKLDDIDPDYDCDLGTDFNSLSATTLNGLNALSGSSFSFGK